MRCCRRWPSSPRRTAIASIRPRATAARRVPNETCRSGVCRANGDTRRCLGRRRLLRPTRRRGAPAGIVPDRWPPGRRRSRPARDQPRACTSWHGAARRRRFIETSSTTMSGRSCPRLSRAAAALATAVTRYPEWRSRKAIISNVSASSSSTSTCGGPPASAERPATASWRSVASGSCMPQRQQALRPRKTPAATQLRPLHGNRLSATG